MSSTFSALLTLSAILAGSINLLTLKESLEKHAVKRVAVFPWVVTQTQAAGSDDVFVRPFVINGNFGPLSQDLPQRLFDKLVNEAEGKFTVVDNLDVVRVCADMVPVPGPNSLTELLKPRVLSAIRERTKADAMLILTIVDQGKPELGANVKVLDLRDGNVKASESGSYIKSLSDAAFKGESFEVRRWVNGRLDPVGLNLTGQKAYAWGEEAEIEQYKNLKSGQQNPLLVEGFPYGIDIVSNNSSRTPLRRITRGNQPYVVIDPSQDNGRFAIRLWNTTEKNVYVALYVDGVNTIGFKPTANQSKFVFEHPFKTPTHRHWFMEPKRGVAHVDGWCAIDPNAKEQDYSQFQIVNKNESIAKESGASNRFGLITAIVYTHGMEGFDAPKDTLITKKGDESPFAIGAGPAEKAEIKFLPGTRGIMLAAMTFQYITAEEIPPVDPNKPPVDPNKPPVDPNKPPVDPNKPPVDPNKPPVQNPNSETKPFKPKAAK